MVWLLQTIVQGAVIYVIYNRSELKKKKYINNNYIHKY